MRLGRAFLVAAGVLVTLAVGLAAGYSIGKNAQYRMDQKSVAKLTDALIQQFQGFACGRS